MAKHINGVKDKIVAKIISEDNITDGGIVLPQGSKQLPQLTCCVTSIGKDVSEEITVGATIYCHRNGGMDIIVDGEIYKVLKDDEVYATVEITGGE